MTEIASILVQFGLTIWAFGGFHAFFSQPAFIALTVGTAVLMVVAMFSQGNVSSGLEEDKGNRWVLAAFAVLALLQAYFPAYTDRIGFWTLGGDAVRWVGLVILAVGSGMRLWPVFVLGRRFSGLVAIQPEHELVTTGVYRRIRNPSYLGLLVVCLGWALVFRSGVGILIALAFIPPLVARIHAEEALLHKRFGSEYDAYCARTNRLIPGLY